LAVASAIDLLRGAASGHKKTRFAHSSGRSRASMFAAALAAASGAYRTLPENVTRVNYSGRRADCNALLHGLPSHAHNAASARKLARKNLSSSGRTATTISRDRNVQPIVGRLRHRPHADRHCCGCLMSAPLGSPGRRTQEGADPPKTGFVGLLQVLELAASAYSAHFRLE
jgi:hypothetical protein